MINNFYLWLKNNRLNILIALVFIITLFLRVYAINHKATIFWDDTASYIVSTINNKIDDNFNVRFKYNWNKILLKYEHNYTAYEIKKALFENKADIKSIWTDVKTLHNETIDHQHPNLYYTILRIWSSGMDFSDYKAMILRGCYLNLIFFTISFFFMYKLLNLIKPDKKFIALGLFFAFTITGSISDTLLIRPYPMAECFFILALYQFLVLYNNIDKEKLIPWKKCILYSIGFALFLLSYYYALIFMAIIFTILTIKCIKTKNKTYWEYIYLILFFAVLLTILFCPLYFYNLTISEHTDSSVSNSAFWNFMNFQTNGIWLLELLNKYVFYNIGFYIIIFGFAIIGIPVLRKTAIQKQEWTNFAFMYGLVCIYMYLITTLCPYKEYAAVRYVIFLFPVISIALTMLVYSLKKEIIIPLILISLWSSFLPIYQYIEDNSVFNYLGTITYYKDFEFLNVNKYLYEDEYKDGFKYGRAEKRRLNSNSDKLLPLVVVNKNNGLWFNYMFYLPNETIVRFEKESPYKDNYIFDSYILLDAGARMEKEAAKKSKLYINKKTKTKRALR